MDKISDLLSHKNLSEPPEIKIIQNYINEKYSEKVSVKIETNKIVIFATNSALASSIRMNIPELQKICDTDKRIVIYIN